MKGNKMKKLLMTASFALIVHVSLTGCTGARTNGMEVSQTEGMTAFVQMDDGSFCRNVEIVESNLCRTELGFLKASARVRNSRSHDFPVQYKFTWFDGNGMEVLPGGRPWEQTTIHGHETASLSATAPEKLVVKYILRLRRVK